MKQLMNRSSSFSLKIVIISFFQLISALALFSQTINYDAKGRIQGTKYGNSTKLAFTYDGTDNILTKTFSSSLIATPKQIQPADEATNQNTNVLVKWNRVSGATSYKTQISPDLTFKSGVYTQSLTDSSLTYLCQANKTYYWRVKAFGGADSSAWSQIWEYKTGTGAAGYTLSGTLKYANSAATAMNNCTIVIKNSSNSEVARATTDGSGNYSVSGLANGTYTIEVYTTKPSGGLNSLDGASLRKKVGNIISYSPIQVLAGDINNNGSINSLDVAPLRQKIGNLTATNWRIANFVFNPTTVTINGENTVLNILSLCGGDVNGSFTPSSN